MKKKSVVAFSSNAYGEAFCKVLIDFHQQDHIELKAVVVAEDERNPLYRSGCKDPVRVLAESHDIAVLQHPDQLLAKGPFDLGLSLINFHILRQKHMDLFEQKIINFHGAPVEWYRGSAAPVAHILYDDTPSWGYTYMLLEESLDEGHIIEQVTYPIKAGLTSEQIDATVIPHALKGFPKMLKIFMSGEYKIKAQDESALKGTFKRQDLIDQAITDVVLNAPTLKSALRAFDWPEVVEHPQVHIHHNPVRLIPEVTYQKMLKVYRKLGADVIN